MSKKCGHCQEIKSLEDFSKNSLTASGLSSYCHKCRSEAQKKWRNDNKQKVCADRASWRKNNREKRRKIERAWRAKNRERHYAMIKEWTKNNREKRNAIAARYAKRHPAKVSLNHRRYISARHISMPSWANEFFMDEAYDLAKLRTKKLGFKWVVDHIVPIRSNIVCGLHTDANLQVIPFTINASKSNRYWPDMP
jgi:thymidine kinase